MNSNYEQLKFSNGIKYIAGVDEVGRGACAGPIVAGAVVFDKNILECKVLIDKVKESKKLDHKKRQELLEIILKNAKSFAVGIVDAQEIDIIDIGNANRLCIKRAIDCLETRPDFIVGDFVQKLEFEIPYELLKKGDDTVITVACASIIAKEHRDALMREYAKEHPEYGFEKHKGYGTKDHYDAMKQNGICCLHRRSFGVAQKTLF